MRNALECLVANGPCADTARDFLMELYMKRQAYFRTLYAAEIAYEVKHGDRLDLRGHVISVGSQHWAPLIEGVTPEQGNLIYNTLIIKGKQCRNRDFILLQQTIRDLNSGILKADSLSIENHCRSNDFGALNVERLRTLIPRLCHAVNPQLKIFSHMRLTMSLKTKCKVRSILKELLSINANLKVDEKVLRRHIKAREPLAGIIEESFFDQRNGAIPQQIRLLVPHRWPDASSNLLDLFRDLSDYAMEQQSEGKREYYLVCTKGFYHLCVALCPSKEDPIAKFSSMTRSGFLTALRKRAGEGGVLYLTKMHLTLYQFTNNGPWSQALNWNSWAPFTDRELFFGGRKRKRSVESRGVFTRSEMDLMFKKLVEDDNVRDLALLTFFMNTGARRRAVSRIKVNEVWDESTQTIRNGLRLREKFEKIRWVRIDSILADRLKAYLQRFPAPGDGYLFAHQCGGPYKINTFSGTWLKRLCSSCGIEGPHVQQHALRRTVITWLYEAGNSVESIRDWIQHEDCKTTQGYIQRDPELIASCVVMPWVEGIQNYERPNSQRLNSVRCRNRSASTSTSTSTSTDGGSVDEMMAEMHAQTIRSYEHCVEDFNYIVVNILSDVQRRKFGEWQAIKVEQRLKEQGFDE